MAHDTMREKALNYLFKRIKKARIALSRAEQKNGAEREIEGLKDKIDVLEWLTGIALKED